MHRVQAVPSQGRDVGHPHAEAEVDFLQGGYFRLQLLAKRTRGRELESAAGRLHGRDRIEDQCCIMRVGARAKLLSGRVSVEALQV